MAEQRHSQSPPESQLWEGAVSPPATPLLTHPHPPWVPRPAPLTRRHHTHTARSAAAGAPPRGTGQRAAAAPPRSGRGPSQPGGHSPAGMPLWTSQTPPQLPSFGTTPHPGFLRFSSVAPTTVFTADSPLGQRESEPGAAPSGRAGSPPPCGRLHPYFSPRLAGGVAAPTGSPHGVC